jgi:hypothetical protein
MTNVSMGSVQTAENPLSTAKPNLVAIIRLAPARHVTLARATEVVDGSIK